MAAARFGVIAVRTCHAGPNPKLNSRKATTLVLPQENCKE